MVKRLADINLIIVVFISLICFISIFCRIHSQLPILTPIVGQKYQLVVSQYKESIDWMDEFDLSNFDVTIYMKYYKQPVTSEYRCIPLQNVGREGATYMHHIIENYDHLPEIVLFTAAGLLESEDKYNKFKHVYKDIHLASKRGIVAVTTSSNNISNFTKNNWQGTTSINYIDRHEYDDSSCNTCLIPASIRPYGEWAKHFLHINIDNTKPTIWSSKGIFAVSKESILRYPKSLYEKILQELSVGDNIEAGHFLERSYVQMFSK